MPEGKAQAVRTGDLLAYCFSAMAFAVFAMGLFAAGPVGERIAETGLIYWFLLSLVATIVPRVKHLKFQDMEIVIREVKRISEEYRMGRDNVWNYVADILNRVSPEAAYELRRELNRYHLPQDPFMEVTDLKRRLMQLGLYERAESEPEALDGSIPRELVDAVLAFQRDNGLTPVDGIVGPYTKETLVEKTGGPRPAPEGGAAGEG